MVTNNDYVLPAGTRFFIKYFRKITIKYFLLFSKEDMLEVLDTFEILGKGSQSTTSLKSVIETLQLLPTWDKQRSTSAVVKCIVCELISEAGKKQNTSTINESNFS